MNRMLRDAENAAEVTAKKDETIPYRFKAGQSGNPGGRPKAAGISTAIRARLKEECRSGDKPVTEEFVEAAIKKARNGDLRALQILIEHAEGA
jgi:hypothetical protein